MTLAVTLCISYTALAVTLCSSLVIQARPLPPWSTNSFSLGLFGIDVVLLGGGFVAMMLQGSYSQTVGNTASAERAVLERNKVWAAVLRAPTNPISGFFTVFVLTALAALAARHPGYFTVNVAIQLIVIAAMAINGHAAMRLARNMCRQAKNDGQIELFRGFDWSRVSVNDRSLFRKRYLSRSWKYPQDIIERAEAQKFAERAHSIRFRWTAVAAVAAAILLAKLDLKAILVEISTPAASEEAVFLALTMLAVIILGPIAVQNHVGNLNDLTKDYEQRAKEIGPGRTINLRPFVSAIPEHESRPEPQHSTTGTPTAR